MDDIVTVFGSIVGNYLTVGSEIYKLKNNKIDYVINTWINIIITSKGEILVLRIL